MDARIVRTKKSIREEFFYLLATKSARSITVKENCDRARINRATFYKHYENVADLMDKLENELIDELQRQISMIHNPTIEDMFFLVLQDIQRNKYFYVALFSENGDKVFKKRVFELCYTSQIQFIRNLFPDSTPQKQEWMFYFIAEGCNGVLNRWIDGGLVDDPADIVHFLKEMIERLNNY